MKLKTDVMKETIYVGTASSTLSCDIIMFHQGEHIQKTIQKIRAYYLFPENSKKCAHFFIFIFF